MKKSVLIMGLFFLSISLLGGCSNVKTNNKVNEINKIAKNTNRDEDIFLLKQKTYNTQKQWANLKDYFIFNDYNESKIYLYKNNKLIYCIDNSKNNDKYCAIQINCSGDNFVCQNIDRNKKQWKLDLFKLEDGSKKETYLQKDELYYLEKWTKDGLFFTKAVSWEEMDGYEKKLYLLTTNKEFKEIWNFENKPYIICDIMDNWVLFKNYENNSLHKFNLKTKEIKDINLKFKNANLHEVYFYNSTNDLVGEVVKNNKYQVFLVQNNSNKIIANGSFIGITNGNIVYKKYNDNIKNGEGNIYVKLIK